MYLKNNAPWVTSLVSLDKPCRLLILIKVKILLPALVTLDQVKAHFLILLCMVLNRLKCKNSDRLVRKNKK